MRCYYVYLLECKNKDNQLTYYVGQTANLKKRTQEHINNVKGNKKKHYTGRQKFIRLAYFEKHKSRKQALKREKEIKQMGRRYKVGLIHGMKATRENLG